MRICHISTEKGFRGGERQLVRIHEGLIELGVESFIVCRSDNRSLVELEKSFALNLRNIGTLFAPLTIARIIQKNKPDLIHCHDSRSLSLIAILKPFLKIPVIVSRKTVYPITGNASAERKFRAVDCLIAVSEAAAQVVRERFITLPVTVIHDGVESEDGKSRTVSRNLLGVSDSTILFATVGYFSTEKNVPLLQKTADHLAKLVPDARIVLIGPVVAKFLPLVENHPSIVLAGKIENAESLYAGFDCYLSASTREGLGSALLDAVVRDIPAISLDSGGSRDIFEVNDPDHCSSENEFIQRVVSFCQNGIDKDRVKARGITARKRFSVDQLKENHLKLYHKLLDHRSR